MMADVAIGTTGMDELVATDTGGCSCCVGIKLELVANNEVFDVDGKLEVVFDVCGIVISGGGVVLVGTTLVVGFVVTTLVASPNSGAPR